MIVLISKTKQKQFDKNQVSLSSRTLYTLTLSELQMAEKEQKVEEIEEEIEIIPQRFIDAEKDFEKGRTRYYKTLEWRTQLRVDTILSEPHPDFKTIKANYPQYFHGRSRDNHPVYYEKSTKINLTAIKNANLSMEDLLRHYIYITEFLWTTLAPDESTRSITVLDVAGVGVSDFFGDVKEFVKKTSGVSSAHYPERSAHIYIINIPYSFNVIWSVAKLWLDPVTLAKVHLVRSGNVLKELEMTIPIDQIPSGM